MLVSRLLQSVVLYLRKGLWQAEWSFAWLNFYPRLSKDYEKTVESALAFIQIAFINILLNRIEDKKAKHVLNSLQKSLNRAENLNNFIIVNHSRNFSNLSNIFIVNMIKTLSYCFSASYILKCVMESQKVDLFVATNGKFFTGNQIETIKD